MADRKTPVVQTAGLCKTFKDFWRRPAVEAVKDLDLEVRPGEVFGLLGPNGSGKTTTIKMLLGLLYPTRGRISLFGKSPTDVAVKGRIGFLPEESYLYRFLVAHETLDYYGRLFRLPARVRRERSERLLDMVGLRHEARRRVGEYSKGMARRIGLAQALINDPEFLILDEPTSGLDPIGARQIKDVIRELGRKGKTILLSSHILADVEDVCDRVTILYGGRQQAAGDINELLRRTEITQLNLPAVAAETVEQIRDLVRRLENKDILEVSHPRAKLEEFFLKIVEEAQAANVRTYGARSGGSIPEFLRKPVDSGEELIESLVSAASPTSALRVPAAPSPHRPGPSREVIDQLLRERGESDVEDDSDATNATNVTDATAAADGKSRDSDAAPTTRPVVNRAADSSVIDELMGRPAGGSEKERS